MQKATSRCLLLAAACMELWASMPLQGCHLAVWGAVGAAPARGDERRHSASPHRSLLEVLQYAGAAVRSLGSAARPAACPDLEAARSDRWLRALWLEGAPPGGKALPPSNPSAEQGG